MSFRVSTTHFKVEIDSIDCSEIQQLSGLNVYSMDSEPYQKNQRKTFTTVIDIERPFIDTSFFDWLSENQTSKTMSKRRGTVAFVTEDGTPIVTFTLEGIFPLEWHAPILQKEDNWGHQQPIERIRLAVERITGPNG